MFSKMIRISLMALIYLSALGKLAQADSLPTLTLHPTSGAITGPAGSTVGWGFTLTNASSDFLVVSGSDFCVGAITSPCSNSLGTYTDFAGAEFFVIGPSPESSSITQAFDNGLQTGIGSFLINPGATGTVNGFIALTYDLFTVDPNLADFDPTLDTVSLGNYLTAPASVTVGMQTTNPVPEPGSLLLLVSGLVLALSLRRRA